MSRSSAREDPIAGFTLIEALVALSIVAVALSAIGALIATTVRGTRMLEAKINRHNTARTVVAASPDRRELADASGYLAGHEWRVDIAPFVTSGRTSQKGATWVPQAIVVTVRSPTAADLQISTVRLIRRDNQ